MGLDRGRKDVADRGVDLFRLTVKNASDKLDANLVRFFRKISEFHKIAPNPCIPIHFLRLPFGIRYKVLKSREGLQPPVIKALSNRPRYSGLCIAAADPPAERTAVADST